MSPRKLWGLCIQAQTPLQLGNESGSGNFEQTWEHIPGAVIRGAVGMKTLLACCKHPDYRDNHLACPDREQCHFWQLFGDEPTFFGPAYPGTTGPVHPMPLTARTCKRAPGMISQQTLYDTPHGVKDILLERLVYELLTDPFFPERSSIFPNLKGELARMTTEWDVEKCPKCASRFIPVTGYYVDTSPIIAAEEPRTRRQAHVGINRRRSVAEDQLLFTQEIVDTLNTTILFWGNISVPEQYSSILATFVEGEHFLGRGRSRGLGKVSMCLTKIRGVSSIENRLADFDLQLSGIVHRWSAFEDRIANGIQGRIFALTLRSPAIFEDIGRSRLCPTPAELGLPQARIVRSWTHPVMVSGWDAAIRLPRRTRLAACAGSVYVVYIPENVDHTSLLEKLTLLETRGIGMEQERGFGQIEVCARFHSNQEVL